MLHLLRITKAFRGNTSQDPEHIPALVNAHKRTLDDPGFSAIVTKHGGKAATDLLAFP